MAGRKDRDGVFARHVRNAMRGVLGDNVNQRRDAYRRPCGFNDFVAVHDCNMAPIGPSDRPNDGGPWQFGSAEQDARQLLPVDFRPAGGKVIRRRVGASFHGGSSLYRSVTYC